MIAEFTKFMEAFDGKPKNVNSNVEELSNVNLIHLDDLSQITDETLQNRI